MRPKVTLVPTWTTGVAQTRGDAECYLTGRAGAVRQSANNGGAIKNSASGRRKSSSSTDSGKNGGDDAAGGDGSSATGFTQSFSSGVSEHLIFRGGSGRVL